jgi:hypothetical protein
MLLFNLYHVGIFECTQELLIHYGEEDENKKKKPLTLEKKSDDELKKYYVIKYFYSKQKPEDFINLIDLNDWTSERFDTFYHNCIHCVNEYLIFNNITPIFYGIIRSVAYDYLCDKCYEESKVKKNLYMHFYDSFYQIYSNTILYESEFSHICEKCKKGINAKWKFDISLMQKSEEESLIIIPAKDIIEEDKQEFEELKEVNEKSFQKKIPQKDEIEERFIQEFEELKEVCKKSFQNKIPHFMENIEDFKKEIEKYKKIGEMLAFALMKVKIQKISKYQYAVVRKDLIDVTGEKERNFGFIALVSLHENKIIEYGNKEYNEGSPVLRNIELEDNYIYHIVKEFQLNINVNELFNSINLTPWKGNRYDLFYYNSYNFINIFLNKYNQKLILRQNLKSLNSAYLYLCRECYKKFNHPKYYIQRDSFPFHTLSKDEKKEDKYWWCWECGKIAKFHFIGVSLNIKYDYLCSVCYFKLGEPKNYVKYNKEYNNIVNYGLVGILLNNCVLNNKELCRYCAKFDADYKCIN